MHKCVGILGGGQLGRMLALAAARLGLRVIIYTNNPNDPALDLAYQKIVASYHDTESLANFAAMVDVITYEFENIPISAAQYLSELHLLHPGVLPLQVSQDRLREKTFLSRLGIPVAPFIAINNHADLDNIARTHLPAILKKRTMSYDGKGQWAIHDRSTLESMTLADLDNTILEVKLSFDKEISIITVRDIHGNLSFFDIPENDHHSHHNRSYCGILHSSRVPADIVATTKLAAQDIGTTIANALGYVGVLVVEMFVIKSIDGSETLVVNEFAPRVHNSGHWTEAACVVSQFDAHMRAICGLPIPDLGRHSDAYMQNIIGDQVENLEQYYRLNNTLIELYGKKDVKPGRKMGHMTSIIAKGKE